MTVLDRVAKTKGALAFEKVQVPQRASRFYSPLCLSLLRLPRRLMTVGFTIKKKGGGEHLSFPGRPTGKGSPPDKAFPLRESFSSLAR